MRAMALESTQYRKGAWPEAATSASTPEVLQRRQYSVMISAGRFAEAVTAQLRRTSPVTLTRPVRRANRTPSATLLHWLDCLRFSDLRTLSCECGVVGEEFAGMRLSASFLRHS